MKVSGFIARAAFVVAFLAVAPILRAQDTVSISDPAEFNAYSAAVSQNDPKGKAAGLESFLTTYPQSVVKKVVLDTLLDTYTSMDDTVHSLNTAARLLQTDPNNLKAIYISVFITKTKCEKNQDAQSCNDAAALAQKGLATTKGAGVSDADWERQTAATYPLFRSAIAKGRATEGNSISRQESPVSAVIASGREPEHGGDTGGGLAQVGGRVSAPVPLFLPEAEFSDEARRAKSPGVCLVGLIVDAQGNPQNVHVVRALGMGLDEKAMEAVRKYKFKPAMQDGKTPVPVYVNVEVNFRFTEGAPSKQNQAIAQPAAEPVQSNSSSSGPTNPKAQEELGEEFDKGKNAHQKDAAQAVYWYRKAAEQGFAKAQNSLGDMYSDGVGVPKDDVQAVTWFQKAADQGDALAQHNLGVMCMNGEGGLSKDESRAVYWWQKAAAQGLANSQYNLGRWYELGRGGLSKDPEKALYWYRKAAVQGHVRASWQIHILAALPQEQFAEELTKRMSGEIWWCAGGRDGQILAGYATTSYLSPKTSNLLETGSQMYIEAFRKGFRFLGMFDRDQDTKTAQLTVHGAAPATLDEISDQNREYLRNATDILMRVANNVNASSQYRIEQEGKEITVCIPATAPDACPAGQIRQFMPGYGEICTPR